MARSRQRKKRYTRNEKIFYVLSLLIIVALFLSLFAAAIAPEGAPVGGI